MKKSIKLDEKVICEEYQSSSIGVESLALKYHVGKKKIKDILIRNSIPIKKRGAQVSNEVFVNDWRDVKYPKLEGKHYVISDKHGEFTSTDVENKSGILTTYIEKTYGITTPTLYERRKYYMKTGNYWWEQWLDVSIVSDKEVKKCPYCDWVTKDVNNYSGMFGVHLKTVHNKTVEEFIKEFPQEKGYFRKQAKKIDRDEKLKNDKCYVVCPICQNKYRKLTSVHMKSYHGLEWVEFKKLYPDVKVMSDEMIEQARDSQKLGNLHVSKNRFISSYEKEINEFLCENSIGFEANRQILIGKEIDILIPSKKIGIEFDGLKFHTEFFGKKNRLYHLDKTVKCNEKGYGLIHIFEDEYVNGKEIVYSKISHLLGLNKSLPVVGARKCVIKEIYMNDAKCFLNSNHLQGYAPSSVYLGAFHNEKLMAVMSFKNGSVKNRGWELTRFATDIHFRCPGIGSKIFRYFVNNYNPQRIFSFADRRWTLDKDNNVYTKLGFSVDRITPPDYRYYNEKVNRFHRFHKMTMNKQSLHKKYGLPLTMTELEMTRTLGYDRIWDCGLIKYVYINPDFKELPDIYL